MAAAPQLLPQLQVLAAAPQLLPQLQVLAAAPQLLPQLQVLAAAPQLLPQLRPLRLRLASESVVGWAVTGERVQVSGVQESWVMVATLDLDWKYQGRGSGRLQGAGCSRQARFQFSSVHFTSLHFSSVQDGIYATGKAHMRSTLSLRSVPNVAFETVPMLV